MSVHRIAQATATTGDADAHWRVELHAGAHALAADEPVGGGGGGTGPSPFGLLLSGLVACTAMTLRMYAERKGWALTSVEVDAAYIVDGDEPSIERTIVVPAAMPADQRARLAEIADRTPVTLALLRGTPITTTIRS